MKGITGLNEEQANELKKVITSIDTDGNGTINYTGNYWNRIS